MMERDMLHRYLKAALFTRIPGDWPVVCGRACPATAPSAVRLIAAASWRLQ